MPCHFCRFSLCRSNECVNTGVSPGKTNNIVGRSRTGKIRIPKERWTEIGSKNRPIEPISVHFDEVYQSHIRRPIRMKQDQYPKKWPLPDVQRSFWRTVFTIGVQNLTITPAVSFLFMVYGGSEGNWPLYQAEMPESIHDRIFLRRRTNRNLALSRSRIIVLPLL